MVAKSSRRLGRPEADAAARPVRRRRPDPRGWWRGCVSAGHSSTMRSASSLAASMRCSQLSRTRRSRFVRSASTMPCHRSPGPVPTPRTLPTTCTESVDVGGGRTSSHSQTPSGSRGSTSAATWSDSRVLPMPPTPVRVTTGAVSSAAATFWSSRSRPTNDLARRGRLFGKFVERAEGREVPAEGARPRVGRCARCARGRAGRARRGRAPRRRRPAASRSSASVACDTISCPPCASRRHPGGTVDRGAEVVAVAERGLTGVHAHADPQGLRASTTSSARSARCASSAAATASSRGGEGGVQTVAGRLHDVPVVRLDRGAEDLVVTRQRRRASSSGVDLPQARRALDDP